MKITCALLTVAAGLCGSAIAADDTSVFVQGPARNAAPYIANFHQNTSRAVGVVYSGLNKDNTVGFEFNGNVSAHSADDFSLVSGPAQTLNPTTVDTFGTIFIRPAGSTTDNFDLTVGIWDSWSISGADDALFDNTTYPGQLLGAFTLQIRGLPSNTSTNPDVWYTGDVDVSSLSIVIPDTGGAVELLATDVGASLPFSNGVISVCNGNAIRSTTGTDDGLNRIAGLSLQRYWRDTVLDGSPLLDSAMERFSGLGLSAGMFAVQIQSDNVKCAADFNNDGFPDFFDFNDFVDAFEAGCP